jgi:hypothetical protein
MIALKRFIVIVVAYVLTVFVAALGGSLAIEATTLISSESMAFVAIMGFAGIIIGMFATIPSVLLIMIAEYFGIRSLWYYAAIAVVAGVVLARVFVNETWMLLVGAGLGVVCGATYWAIAGRKAGILKSFENTKAQTQLLLLLAATIATEAVLLLVFMR